MIEQLAIPEGVTIYALSRPGGPVRYVGKTIGTAARRLVYHLRGARRGDHHPFCSWLRRCISEGVRPQITILEIVAPEADWAARERFWIAHYRRSGARLFNLTDGGEGLSGHHLTEIHRERIAAKLRKGAWFNCEQCSARFWRKPRDIKAGNSRFCTRACYFTWQVGKPKRLQKRSDREKSQ